MNIGFPIIELWIHPEPISVKVLPFISRPRSEWSAGSVKNAIWIQSCCFIKWVVYVCSLITSSIQGSLCIYLWRWFWITKSKKWYWRVDIWFNQIIQSRTSHVDIGHHERSPLLSLLVFHPHFVWAQLDHSSASAND